MIQRLQGTLLTSASIAGLVLAGGRSSRFGADKALANFRGRSLLQRGLERFSGCAARAVSVRGDGLVAESARALGVHVLKDRPGSASGPLSGVLEGLAWARSQRCDLLATAPCDAPLLSWEHYQRLLDRLDDAPAVFAATEAGDHPLCAIWRGDLLPTLENASANGEHPSVRGFLRDQGARCATFADVGAFGNANTPSELARIAAIEAAP